MGQDTHAMMLYEANKKSTGIAFALWFFAGVIGAHRFYIGRRGGGWMIAFFILGLLTLSSVWGQFILGALAVWALIDAFALPGWARDHNTALAAQLSGPATVAARTG